MCPTCARYRIVRSYVNCRGFVGVIHDDDAFARFPLEAIDRARTCQNRDAIDDPMREKVLAHFRIVAAATRVDVSSACVVCCTDSFKLTFGSFTRGCDFPMLEGTRETERERTGLR